MAARLEAQGHQFAVLVLVERFVNAFLTRDASGRRSVFLAVA